jgi:hypothetical protein
MRETLLSQLEEPEARAAVADVLIAIFLRWGLHEVNQAALLNIVTLADLINKKLRDAPRETMERAGHLLAIERALHKRFPFQPRRRETWVMTPNTRLQHTTPLWVMLKNGLPGIQRVRELAEDEAR